MPGGEQLVIRGVGRVVSPEEIAELPVKFAAAVMPLRVKDLAEVQIGHAFRTGAATHSGRGGAPGRCDDVNGREQPRCRGACRCKRSEEIQKRLPAGGHQPGIQQKKSGPSNNSHRGHESFRRRVAGHGRVAFSPGKLARRVDCRDQRSRWHFSSLSLE